MADEQNKPEEKVVKKVDPNATEKYKLIRGKHLGVDPDTGEDKLYKLGDWIFLNAAQAKSFGDKVKSQKVLRAEAAAFEESDTPDSTQQPVAPLGPVDPGTNELENGKDAEGQDKQTTQPTGGDGKTTPPTKPATPAAPAK